MGRIAAKGDRQENGCVGDCDSDGQKLDKPLLLQTEGETVEEEQHNCLQSPDQTGILADVRTRPTRKLWQAYGVPCKQLHFRPQYDPILLFERHGGKLIWEKVDIGTELVTERDGYSVNSIAWCLSASQANNAILDKLT